MRLKDKVAIITGGSLSLIHILNNPEEFHWHDEYATLNFFRFICKNIGNLRNGEIEKMEMCIRDRRIQNPY